MPSEKSLCFMIYGEDLTRLCRSLWADELEVQKAFNILKAAFPSMSQSDMGSILVGEKKMVGDSSAGIILEKDNTTHTEYGNPLSFVDVYNKLGKKLINAEKDKASILATLLMNSSLVSFLHMSFLLNPKIPKKLSQKI